MIPREKIDEVRARANIVQVVSEYLPLKKKGVNWFGLCPFHSEKSPSFSVNEARNIFHCFGCHETGNAITFIMKKEGLTFPEAVMTLASRYGVVIKEEKRAACGLKDSLFGVNAAAVEYFAGRLDSPEGRSAREYLKKRGFGDKKLLERFAIGLAPGGWEALTGYLRKKGFSLDLAEKAGVVSRSRKKAGEYYDRFRGRLIFPITDIRGRTIGFGARALDGEDPKYLNTPETALFKKGEVLFGLKLAREAMREKRFVIVVEGYFDLLALHLHGFTNSVATMGTALTREHLRAIKGYVDSVYTLFDPDEAGLKASLRGLELFLEEEMPCRMVMLSGGKDPDEFLKEYGPSAMATAVGGAEPLMGFYLKELKKGFPLDTPEGKSRYLENAVARLVRIKDVAERDHYASEVSSTASLSLSAVYEAMRSGKKTPGIRSTSLKDLLSLKPQNLAELTVLKVIVAHPELYSPRIREAVEAFGDSSLKELGLAVMELCTGGGAEGGEGAGGGEGFNFSELVERIDDEKAKAYAGEVLIDDEGFIEDPEKMLEDSLKKVLNRGKLKTSTRELIKRLEDSGKTELAETIRQRVHRGSHNM